MVTHPAVKIVEPKDLHIDTLSPATRRAFLGALSLDFISSPDWYLAGGTALALQVGHRKSVDLDFFTTERDFHYLTILEVTNYTNT